MTMSESNDRVVTAEAERDVIRGVDCGKDGRDFCGVCIRCAVNGTLAPGQRERWLREPVDASRKAAEAWARADAENDQRRYDFISAQNMLNPFGDHPEVRRVAIYVAQAIDAARVEGRTAPRTAPREPLHQFDCALRFIRRPDGREEVLVQIEGGQWWVPWKGPADAKPPSDPSDTEPPLPHRGCLHREDISCAGCQLEALRAARPDGGRVQVKGFEERGRAAIRELEEAAREYGEAGCGKIAADVEAAFTRLDKARAVAMEYATKPILVSVASPHVDVQTGPRWTVSAYLTFNDHVLLIHHDRLKMWLPIGGGIEPGERPIEAVRREVKEETGLAVDEFHWMNYGEHLAGGRLHMNHAYRASLPSTFIPTSDGSWKQSMWLRLGDDPPPETPPNVRAALSAMHAETL